MSWLFQESRIGLESVFLILFAMMMLILGVVLLTLPTGTIGYSAFGFYGVTLFLFGFQIISLGKTPIGDAKQSPLVFGAGLAVSILGIILCFTNSVPEFIPKYLIAGILFVSGIVLLIQMFVSKNLYPLWKKSGDPLLMRLALLCALVYIFDIIVAVFIFLDAIIPLVVKSVFALLFGILLLLFTVIRHKTDLKYPLSSQSKSIGLNIISILIFAVYLIVLGVLLIYSGLSPIAITGSSQLGLMMVIFAIQTIAIGSTPIGPFKRTHLIVIIGIVLGVIGITAVFVPGVLDFTLTVLIGLLNIISAVLFFIKSIPPLIKSKEPMPKILKQITVSSIIMNIMAFTFGLSMLIPNLIPGSVIVFVLIIFGCLILYLVSRLVVAEKMSASETN
ncbi:MAG: hypothetical protein Q4Q53_01960 [Methanocorpusculum sp.]|nr:hypothetical protein [Methanocorpusculum sp.]